MERETLLCEREFAVNDRGHLIERFNELQDASDVSGETKKDRNQLRSSIEEAARSDGDQDKRDKFFSTWTCSHCIGVFGRAPLRRTPECLAIPTDMLIGALILNKPRAPSERS